MRVRRILTSLAALAAVLTGGGAADDDDPGEWLRAVPAWATRAVVAGGHVEVDLDDSVTGTDLALFVAGAPAATLDFHTLSGARLRVARPAEVDRSGLGAATTAWLAYAAADGSADATLDARGRLTFADGT